MAQMYGTVRTLSAVPVSDAVFTTDNRMVATRGDTLLIFDLATGKIAAEYVLGGSLGAVDVSADGRRALVVDRAPGDIVPGEFSDLIETRLWQVDLGTGEATAFTTTVDFYEGGFFDASYNANGDAVLTHSGQWGTLRTLDLDTGVFTSTPDSFYGTGVLTADADDSTIAFLPGGISDAPVFVYETGLGVVARHEGYEDDVAGYNGGVQAISPDGNVIVQGLGGFNVYDAALDYQFNSGTLFPAGMLTSLRGLSFSSSGERLFAFDEASRSVYEFETESWNVLRGFTLDEVSQFPAQGYGNTLQLTTDGKYLSWISDAGLSIVDLTAVIYDAGSEVDDVVTVVPGGYAAYGFDGDDRLIFDGDGAALYGGAGDDAYILGMANFQQGTVNERADEGEDTVYASGSHLLDANVENLILTAPFATDGTGTGEDNEITGSAAANVLQGLAGDDLLLGGAGDDQLIGGLGNDRIDGGEGFDIAQFADALADVSIEFVNAGIRITGNSIGSDFVTGVERYEFAGTVYDLGDLAAQVTTPVAIGFHPTDGETVASTEADIRIGFSAPVRLGSGFVTIRATDGSLVERFDIATSTRVALSETGNSLTIDPTASFDFSTAYRVEFEQTAIVGADGSAVVNLKDFSFTTAADLNTQADYLFLANGVAGQVSGYATVFGSNGVEDFTVVGSGNVLRFDGSFNRGGDRIHVEGDAANYTIRLLGSVVELAGAGNLLILPVGSAGLDFYFDDGVRSLRGGDTSGITIGTQVVTGAGLPILAAAKTPVNLGAVDSSRGGIIVALDDAQITAHGIVTVIGMQGRDEILIANGAQVMLDASFNSGGDVIAFNALADGYVASMNGSAVVLQGFADVVTIPVGTAEMTLRFADGEATMSYDTGLGAVRIGDLVLPRGGSIWLDQLTTEIPVI